MTGSPRFVRVVEVGSISQDILCSLEDSLKEVWAEWDRLHPRAGGSNGEPRPTGRQLVLVSLGTADFICIQEVPDLNNLGTPATRAQSRFQRSTGAWVEAPDDWLTIDRQRPYVAIGYLNFNALAELVVGAKLINHVVESIPKWIDKEGIAERLQVWTLQGLDTAQLVVIASASKLKDLEHLAWTLRSRTLAHCVSPGQIDPGELAGHLNQDHGAFQQVRVLSWSHSIVGVPLELVKDPPDESLQEPQDIVLRTRYRLLPGCHEIRIGDDVVADLRSVLGNHDLVKNAPEGTTNKDVYTALKVALSDKRGFLAETEVEFTGTQRPGLSSDPVTDAFVQRLARWPEEVEGFPNKVFKGGPHRWSYQRRNGAVNVTLAFAQRLTDPFKLGQAWWLRDNLAYWYAQSLIRDPQQPDLVRWTNHLERAIRLDDNQEDPSYRPSLPLAFASRGGYVTLREAFVAYIEEAIARRAEDRETDPLRLPLVVDSMEPRLKVKPTLGTFILLVSGFQIQALPLWPYVVHEIEHIYLGQCKQEPLIPDSAFQEALCDLAMIESGALGVIEAETAKEWAEIALDRVMGVVFWSLAASLMEAKPQQTRSNGDRVHSFPLRLAYLWMLVHNTPIDTKSLDEALDAWLWRHWAGPWATLVRFFFQEGADLKKHTREMLRIELHRSKAVPERYQRGVYEPLVVSPPKPCMAAIAKTVYQLPHNTQLLDRGEVGLDLQAQQICPTIVELREPVANTRRKHVLEMLRSTKIFSASSHV